MDDNNHIDFNAPATLRKWPSIKNERASTADGPYLKGRGSGLAAAELWIRQEEVETNRSLSAGRFCGVARDASEELWPVRKVLQCRL
jgi:hypothetical protein